MDIENVDTVIDAHAKTVYHLELCFTDKADKQTTLSPTVVFEQVKEMIKKNTKEVRNTVGRLGDLLVGVHCLGNKIMFDSGGASFFFAVGWYFRKAIENLESQYGKCKIRCKGEEISKEIAISYVVGLLRKESERIGDVADSLSKGEMDGTIFSDDTDLSEPT